MKTSLCPCCQALTTPFGLRVDVARGTISWGEKSVYMPRSEITLAALLAKNYGRVTTRSEIDMALWGDDPNGGPVTADKIIHLYATKLRTALRAVDAPVIIPGAYYGRGYEFAVPKKSQRFTQEIFNQAQIELSKAHVMQE